MGLDGGCLVDADRAYFRQVATEKLPRTYLLDRNGKILWFDLEYSRSMRRELQNAIQYYLRDSEPSGPAAASPPMDKTLDSMNESY